MLKCYTITSLKSLQQMPALDVCQFTLYSGMFPAKRKTVELLKSLSKTCQTKVIVHYDFIYIASRFGMFSERVQSEIINEVVDILQYASFDNRILGIVMHTDYPVKSSVVQDPTPDTILSELRSSIWNSDIVNIITTHLDNIVEWNLQQFCTALESALEYHGIKTPIRVYLENTTKVGPNDLGSFDNLLKFVTTHNFPHIGLCFDSEHHFAVTGEFVTNVSHIDVPLIYHLNTIPEEVNPFSKKDRHSFTTLTECSVNTLKKYVALTEHLEKLHIPYVREVKEETMFREIEQLQGLGIYGC